MREMMMAMVTIMTTTTIHYPLPSRNHPLAIKGD